jgi:hypothetical protein
MNLLSQLASIIGTAILLLILWAVAANLPKYKRVMPDAGYRDMQEIDQDATTGVDATIGIAQLRRGDMVAFRPSADDDQGAAFGYVAGLPGEILKISDGTLQAGDEPWSLTSIPRHLGEVPALPVPADHLYILSDGHQFDSTRLGPLPGAFLIGRVKD